MSFTIEAGTDLYGTKHNILLSFHATPSLYDFVRNVEAQFDVKARSTRPAGYPDIPFKVETLQIFGDQGSWVDLVSNGQLRPGSQVWVFQPESIWHSDAQGVIPKAEQTTQWAPRPGSPSRQRQPVDSGCPATLVEKMTACFHEIDGQGKGYLLREDIENSFHRADIQLQPGASMFQQADLNRSGHVTWDEWQQFAIKNPSIVDALFFRLRDAPVYSAPPPLAYVSRQAGFPGSPAPYNPPPASTYSAPPGYRSPQHAAPPMQHAAPPMQHAPPPMQHAAPPMQHAVGKSYEQEVREFMDQTSPERLREGSPSRLPPQEYMQRAVAQSGQGAAPGMHHQGGYQPQPAGYASPPAPAPGGYGGQSYGSPPPAGGYRTGNSPGRDRAFQHYEQAKQRADAARMQKEHAEREEREAWDRLYETR